MSLNSEFNIEAQPDDTTCGPACLASVLRFYGDSVTMEEVIRECPNLEEGGTLAVYLGNIALQRGYSVVIYTYNLRVFDPTWFSGSAGSRQDHDSLPHTLFPCVDLAQKLADQRLHKPSVKLQMACEAYVKFVEMGGKIVMHELTDELLKYYLERNAPILTGLSSTWLYQSARQISRTNKPDDVRGTPEGHFVVLYGCDDKNRTIRVADPWRPNPYTRGHEVSMYEVSSERLVSSILLGVLTYDSNLLIVEPARE